MSSCVNEECQCHQEWERAVPGRTWGFQTGVANRDGCSLVFSREKLDGAPTRGFYRVEIAETMEAFAVLPRFRNLFSPLQLATARDRLDAEGFDIGAHIAGAAPRTWNCPTDCPQRMN